MRTQARRKKTATMEAAMDKAKDKAGVPKHSRSTIKEIPLKSIEPGPNTRGPLKDPELEKLVTSVEARGLLQPIGVRPHPSRPHDKYILIYGFRRYKAAKILGWTDIRCVVHTKVDTDAGEDLLQNASENWVRSNPSLTEQGKLFDQLMKMGMTQNGIAKRTGMSHQEVNRTLQAYTGVPLKWRKHVTTLKKSGVRPKKQDGEAAKIPLTVANDMVTLVQRYKLSKMDQDRLYKHFLNNATPRSALDVVNEALADGKGLRVALDRAERVKSLAVFVRVDMPKAEREAKKRGFNSVQEFGQRVLKNSKIFPTVE